MNRQRLILIVDDEPSIRTTLDDILSAEGYAVATAENGAAALAAIERSRPALVLLDMRMPTLDGWDFARALEANGPRIPIVVMTASTEAWRWAKEIRAAACLAKPFDLLDLLSAVERVLAEETGSQAWTA